MNASCVMMTCFANVYLTFMDSPYFRFTISCKCVDHDHMTCPYFIPLGPCFALEFLWLGSKLGFWDVTVVAMAPRESSPDWFSRGLGMLVVWQMGPMNSTVYGWCCKMRDASRKRTGDNQQLCTILCQTQKLTRHTLHIALSNSRFSSVWIQYIV